MYIFTSLLVLGTPNAGKCMLLSPFCMKNVKKGTKRRKKEAKKCVIGLNQNADQKSTFIDISTSIWVFLPHFPSFSFSIFFMQKHEKSIFWLGFELCSPNAGQNIQQLTLDYFGSRLHKAMPKPVIKKVHLLNLL